MSQKNRRKRNRRGRKATTAMKRPRRAKPKQVIFDLDGSGGDCSCPVCASLATAGETVHVIGPDGKKTEKRLKKPEMMEVIYSAAAAMWPHLDTEPTKLSVPVGCTVHDFIAYVYFGKRELTIAFPPELVTAKIAGSRCEPNRKLCAGEHVKLIGTRDAELSKLYASILSPLPHGMKGLFQDANVKSH